jgi:carbohydrate-binding DOMON domain-containing protein
LARLTSSGAVTFILVILICAVLGGIAWSTLKNRYNAENVIFTMDDVKSDDYGPGKYKYPTDSIFDSKKKHFDLQRFSLLTQRNNYYFDMTFPVVTNPWGASEGFSHTMVQIYISANPDNGRIETFKEGANVLFSPSAPWKYFIKVVSFNKSAVFWDTDFSGAEGRSKGVVAKLRPDKKTVMVSIPKALLPGDPYSWKFYVLVGSLNGLGPDNFRVVKSAVSQWNFGGGTDTGYNPNIIDMLAPPGAQEKMLSSYNVSKRSLAMLEPVGPSQIAPSFISKFMDKIIAVLIGINVKL